MILLITFVAFFSQAWSVSSKSKRGRKDFISFFFIEYFDSIFQVIGEWGAFFELYRKNRN